MRMPKLLLVALLFLASSPQSSPTPAPSSPPAAKQTRPASATTPRVEPETPWQPLFNGKDLTGWVKVGNEKWEVESGEIHGSGLTKDYGYLRTDKPYKDFEMSMRFKCETNGNSGLFVHTDFKPGTADVSQGMQFEIDCTLNHHTTGLYGDGRAWIAWPAPENETVVRPTDWNDLSVRVIANRFVARLNGVPMIDFTDPTPKSFDGYIALQLHAGGAANMRFKDINIRDLSRR
jgi:hypothetical protein